ncbi:Mu transposase C-terminal domain-containing protein [Streptomyces aculeolatus]
MPARRTDDTERTASVTHLLALEAAGELTPHSLRTVAAAHGRSIKSVKRWMQRARDNDGRYQRKQRDATEVTPRMEEELIRWCGSIAAAHRTLRNDGAMPLSYSAFHRAVTRTYPPSFLDGLRGGEKARRQHDLWGSDRDRGRRNDAWEADHKEADVWVNVDGTARKPCLTLIVNCSNTGICGWAVTPHTPSSQAIIVTIHSALQRGGDHGPFGGIPKLIRVDRGADFLSKAVGQTMAALGVTRVELPPRRPDLKPYVEATNKGFKDMLFRGMPAYTHRPSTDPAGDPKPPPLEDLRTFEQFTAEVRDFVYRWNHVYRSRSLGNRTRLEAWKADHNVIHDLPPGALRRSFPRVSRIFTITNTGIDWNDRTYLKDWMRDHIGTRVHLRHLPGQYATVEVYDAETDQHYGTAHWTNAANSLLLKRVKDANAADRARLEKALNERPRIVGDRYAATTTPEPPRPLTNLTTEQARQRLEDTGHSDPFPSHIAADDDLPEPTSSWTATGRQQPAPDNDDDLPAPTASWLSRRPTTPHPNAPEEDPL